MPLIGRWKMLDNLRRTLSAPAAWLTLVARLDAPPQPAAVWTVFVLVTIALPALLPAFADVIPERSGISKRDPRPRRRTELRHRAVPRSASASRSSAHQAWLMGDAIARTLVRLYLTRRTLLEWTTAAQAKSAMSREITGVYRRMRGALVLAVAGGAWWPWRGRTSAVRRRAVPRCCGGSRRWWPDG